MVRVPPRVVVCCCSRADRHDRQLDQDSPARLHAVANADPDTARHRSQAKWHREQDRERRLVAEMQGESDSADLDRRHGRSTCGGAHQPEQDRRAHHGRIGMMRLLHCGCGGRRHQQGRNRPERRDNQHGEDRRDAAQPGGGHGSQDERHLVEGRRDAERSRQFRSRRQRVEHRAQIAEGSAVHRPCQG